MSQASRSLATKKQVISSEEVDRGPSISQISTASLSQRKYSFTRRAAPRQVATTYTAAILQTNDDPAPRSGKPNNASEPWMESVTPGQFSTFQLKVFPIVQAIANKPENAHHPFIIKWEKLCSTTLHKYPMNATISWRSLKGLLGLTDIFDYKDFLLQCPELDEYIKFTPSQTTKNGFDYGIYERSHHESEADILPTSSHSVDSPSTIGTDSYVLDFNDHKPELRQRDMDENSSATRLSKTNLEEHEEPVVLTPKQTNVNYLPHIVSVTRTNDTVNNASTTSSILTRESTIKAEDTAVAWNITDDSPGFRQVHYRLFESVTTWYQLEHAKQHPFHVKWQKALHGGLQATTPWAHVAKILKLEYVKDYIKFMQECPRINGRYELKWSYFDNAVSYTELDIPALDEINHDISIFNKIQRHVNAMALKFDSMLKDIEQRVDAVDLRTTMCEDNILNRVSTRFTTTVTHHMDRIASYAATTLQTFQTNRHDNTDQQLLSYSENIANMQQSGYERMEQHIAKLEQKLKAQADQLEALFNQRFDQAMEVGIQEIHECVDDVTEKLNAHAKTVIQNINAAGAAKVDSVPKHPRFHNVDPAYAAKIMNFVPSNPYTDNPVKVPTPREPEHYDAPTTATDERHTDTSDQWGKDGPTYQPTSRLHSQQPWYPSASSNHPSIDGMPMVQHNDFMKSVTITYPGREQSYTWYLQIKSAAQQYGIYGSL